MMTILDKTVREIAQDLAKYNGLTGENFFTFCVNEKLNSQIRVYLTELNRELTIAHDLTWGKEKVKLFKQLTEIQKDQAKKLNDSEDK